MNTRASHEEIRDNGRQSGDSRQVARKSTQPPKHKDSPPRPATAPTKGYDADNVVLEHKDCMVCIRYLWDNGYRCNYRGEWGRKDNKRAWLKFDHDKWIWFILLQDGVWIAEMKSPHIKKRVRKKKPKKMKKA